MHGANEPPVGESVELTTLVRAAGRLAPKKPKHKQYHVLVGSNSRTKQYLLRSKPGSFDKWEIIVTETLKTLSSVATQLMNKEEVLVDGQKIKVKRVGAGKLRIVQFNLNGRTFEAIEQNRAKPSRWGKLARARHQVVQFRDVEAHKYVAVSVDGEVMEYRGD